MAIFARAPWLLIIGVVCLCAGCGPSVKQQQDEQSSLRGLAVTYGRFTAQHRGTPPQNEAEFKAYVDAQRPEDLAALGVSDPAKLWISSRDQQPYVVLYGAPTGPAGPAGRPVIAYEAKGVGGKRQVASELGAVEEVDEARFKELVPAAVTAP